MPDQALSPGSLIGLELSHYRIIEEIGSGGMGVVYRARDAHLDREVAIKVLSPGTISDEAARKHLRKEALALSKLNHPNIATVYDFDTQRGVDFLVMEYIAGITLSRKLAAGPLSENEVLRLGMQLADGLAAAHEHGVVHRDLKPGNLRLTSDARLKILDFGIAKLRQPLAETAATESSLQTHLISGTLPYMAPEQLSGEEVDARTDIHGAGFVLYEMATGQRPFAEVPSGQLIGALLHKPPIPPTSLNPKVSAELERIIGKCVEKEPENRYQSAKELAIDLRRLGAPSTTATPLPQRTRRTRNLVLIAAALLVAVCATLLAFNLGGSRDRLLGIASPPLIHSLAVLPLENLSGDPEKEYFADGMTDALITELGKVHAVRIISHRSVMQYKGSKKPLPQIAQELRVDGVVEGSVLREGNRVRISAQLIGTSPERHLWANSYERDLRDILALQSDVSRTIAKEIDVRLSPEEKHNLAKARPVNPEAYDLSLKGLYFLNKDNPEGFLKAVEYFQRAVNIDATYAPAQAGLSLAYSTAGLYGVLPFKDAMPKAKVAAQRALELDESLAEAHVALGGVMVLYDRDWVGADREFKRALDLAPNSVLANLWYGFYLAVAGRFDEAIAVRRRALDLDPLSITANDFLAWTLYYSGHYDEAIRLYRKIVEMEPGNAYIYMWLSTAYLAAHASAESIAACRKAVELAPEDQAVLAFCGHNLALSGRRQEAVALLHRVEALSLKNPLDPYFLALLYAGLGDKDRALALLERAFEEHSPNMNSSPAADFSDTLGSDPRFQDLVRRMNFPH